ncbi:FecR family protein [Croceitalea marina]|uniref:FecR family protein n=1 Tax=Croceitalea marina TaxID=1775166 RepID=A0ABW5N103_9FLAO
MDKENLIQKWVLNQLSEEEKKEFNALDNAPFFERIVKDASHFKAADHSEYNDFDSFRSKVMQPETKVRKLHYLRPLMRIASVLIVVFGLYYFFLNQQPINIQTQVAQQTTVELPDASTVTLNALSEISYSKQDWADKREVKLVGEAFFDVAKGAKFDVVTSEGTISVLGTEFNVKQRDDFFEVACFEGTVRVVANGHTQILKQGDNFRIQAGKALSGEHNYDAPKWTNNISYFERTPLSEVFAELERQYGVSVTSNTVDAKTLFTGGFAHGDLDSALKAIGEALELDYEILKPKEIRFSMRE